MRLLLVLVVFGLLSATANAKNHRSQYQQTRRAVCYYFRGYLCDQAMEVVKCETGGSYSPWAENGQYVNIFQMGLHERQTFGWHDRGSSVWKAARAARHYFDYEVANGYNGWTPWECKPYT